VAQGGICNFIFMKCEGLRMAISILGIAVRVITACSGLGYLNIQQAKAADLYFIISPDHPGTVSTGAGPHLSASDNIQVPFHCRASE
jgi:hypothetical protein